MAETDTYLCGLIVTSSAEVLSGYTAALYYHLILVYLLDPLTCDLYVHAGRPNIYRVSYSSAILVSYMDTLRLGFNRAKYGS